MKDNHRFLFGAWHGIFFWLNLRAVYGVLVDDCWECGSVNGCVDQLDLNPNHL